ncbi:hypothetical protein AB1Y20_020136 [Prymnesium parvum]|uniref:Uncharacterized protein n=1 Tax=Prymnesium parvum TaxID=97485 RepID=A0AB34JSR2_PRYPA
MVGLVCLLTATAGALNSGSGKGRALPHSHTRRAVAAGLLPLLSMPPASSFAYDELPPAVFKDAAREGDIGTRPVILGVPAGLVYFGFAATVQLTLFLRGKSGTMLQNGTVVRDGKRLAQPFRFSADEAARAASQASIDGGSNSTRGKPSAAG